MAVEVTSWGSWLFLIMNKSIKNNNGRGFWSPLLCSYVKCMQTQSRTPCSDTEKHVNTTWIFKGPQCWIPNLFGIFEKSLKNQLHSSICWEEETEHVFCWSITLWWMASMSGEPVIHSSLVFVSVNEPVYIWKDGKSSGNLIQQVVRCCDKSMADCVKCSITVMFSIKQDIIILFNTATTVCCWK